MGFSTTFLEQNETYYVLARDMCWLAIGNRQAGAPSPIPEPPEHEE